MSGRILFVHILILTAVLNVFSEDASEDSDESHTTYTTSHEHEAFIENNAVSDDDDDEDGKGLDVSQRVLSRNDKVIKVERNRRVNSDNEGKVTEENVTEADLENPEVTTVTTSGNAAKPCKKGANETVSTFYPYRYTAAILRKGSYYAAGALITPKLVLTAAGPFFTMHEQFHLLKVRLGSLNNKKGGKLMPVKSIEIHPSYDPKKPDFDVALIEMGSKAKIMDNIKPTEISKSDENLLVAKFLVSYWPRLIVDGVPIPNDAEERVKYNYLRVSLQSFVPWDDCSKQYTPLGVTLHDSSLCLKPLVTHHSVCMPDAGAPVIAEDGLWGVTSSFVSSNCKTSPSPTLFTRLATPIVKFWIDENKKSSC